MPDWNQHYLTQEVDQQTPTEVLKLNFHLLPASGKVLDYACGLAASGCSLAHRGFEVTAWDKSPVAIQKVQQYCDQYGLKINAAVRDLENNPPTDEQFDMVVVSHFLHRPTLKNLQSILRPNGLLFYQTFSGEQREGRGPSNPDFRLHLGELLSVFSDMQILFYREDQGFGDLELGIRDQALLVAAKQ